ncbi:MAG: hypothetical protein WKF97_04030 [Chitinophagaceae bacterium]
MLKFNYTHLLPQGLSPDSKVWIYQSMRIFTLNEALQIEEMLEDFTDNWLSHGAMVKGYANLLFGQFIVIMADERETGVSGCSTDSSVRMIKEIEKLFHVNLFDRQLLAFIIKNKIELLPLSQVPYAIENGFIDAETVYFNNLIQNKAELESKWMIPLKESWLAARFHKSIPISR